MLEKSSMQWHNLMEIGEKEGWWNKKFGYFPSPPDSRDFPLTSILKEYKKAPEEVILDSLIRKVLNQGRCGTCVSKTVNAAMSAGAGKDLSSLFNYILCKEEDGLPNIEGTFPRVSLKIAKNIGSCSESLLPYSKLKECLTFPEITEAMRISAGLHKIDYFARIYSLEEIQQSLAAKKLVVGGILITDSFLNWDKKGNIPVPEGRIYGAHAVLATGYRNSRRGLRALNSWGEIWGDNGWFWLDYDFINWKSDLGFSAWMEGWAVDMNYEIPEKDKLMIVMWVGEKTALVNGKEVKLDVAPKIENNRTLVPIRFVSENMGYKVDYIHNRKEIRIFSDI